MSDEMIKLLTSAIANEATKIINGTKPMPISNVSPQAQSLADEIDKDILARMDAEVMQIITHKDILV